MEKEILIGIIGIITAYLVFKFLMRDENSKDEMDYSNIIDNKEYKVKGQWEK